MKNGLDEQYIDLLKDILENGVEKEDRTGTGTISVFGRQIRHDMKLGFPLLTTKKMYFKGIVTELLWFLKGDTNIKYLVDNDCNIWNGDAYKSFCNERLSIYEKLVKQNPTTDFQPWRETVSQEEFVNNIKTDEDFAIKWGSLGPIYGAQWRRWKRKTTRDEKIVNLGIYTKEIDQIQNILKTLKTNPDSRRMVVSSWNVGDLDEMTLPPCHNFFQFYTRELSEYEKQEIYFLNHPERLNTEKFLDGDIFKEILKGPQRAISLMFNMRSNDLPLGLPFNIASYALLLEIIGKMANMMPSELIVNIGDAHIYKNQMEGIKEQLNREPYQLPNLTISDSVNFDGSIDNFLDSCSISDFKINDYKSHPSIKMPLSN